MTEAELRGRLAGRLEEEGELPRVWREAYDAAPRHLFAPARGWAIPDDGSRAGYPIDRDSDPAAWWESVYADASVITQADDGAGDPATGEGSWTSSLSSPGAVFANLGHLHPRDGQRVLDVGTGTGWTAALLSARVGDANVTSVEVDQAVAEQAAKNLAAAGYRPDLVVGDGAYGHARNAPYDRVHATFGVQTVPWAWVEQTRPGGVIVTPWSPGWEFGHLLRLTVGRDRAVGRMVRSAGYMMMRAQRHPIPARTGTVPDSTATLIDPRDLLWDDYGADLAIAALVPGVVSGTGEEDGGLELRVWDGGGSWATVTYQPGRREFEVLTYGPRRLWEEVADAYLTWVGWGRPKRDRFGMTVTPEGQQVWLDSPERVIG
ncbi:methyltransferase domain-containing protein [Nonomuraea sp. NPDC046570]|uniref:methyltransferase domain-containing protein n=1 Tax=Nonomuraea sp. NPDC046570 TaxID=3155255 RepID=UPI003404CE59